MPPSARQLAVGRALGPNSPGPHVPTRAEGRGSTWTGQRLGMLQGRLVLGGAQMELSVGAEAPDSGACPRGLHVHSRFIAAVTQNAKMPATGTNPQCRPFWG